MLGGSDSDSALGKQQNGTTTKLDTDKNSTSLTTTLDYSTSHAPASSGSTLLPRPVASLVSFLTHSTSLSLRLGTFFGGVALDGARVTTLTGLELSRAVIEGILTRAGRDIAIQSNGERGKVEAEGLLERSLATLHYTVTSASFFAAASFHLSSTTLSSVSHLSQALLSTLDAILGSSESSRAIAAIITLIRREFRKSELDGGTDVIGVGDLLVGSVGFAMLQRWGRKNTESDLHESGGDETIWDVVILDNGMRADVIGTRPLDFARDAPNDLEKERKGAASFISLANDEEAFDAVERPTSMVDTLGTPHLALPADNQHQISDEDIRLYIMQQLPRGCRASIKSETITARTITVDIFDDDTAEIAAPPGTKMIEERFHHDQDYTTNDDSNSRHLPKHTLVFRTAFNKSKSADVRPQAGKESQPESGRAATPDISISRDIINTKSLPAAGETRDMGKTHNEKSNRGEKLENTAASIPKGAQNSHDDRQDAPQLSISQYPYIRPGNTRALVRRLSGEPTSPPPPISPSPPTSPSPPISTLPQSGTETAKSTFGKSSLAKIANKVKPGGGEKTESRKRQSLKKPKLGSSSPTNSPQAPKAHRGSKPEKKGVSRTSSARLKSKVKPNETSAPSSRPVKSRPPNKGPPSTPPLPNSSKVRSGPASNSKRHVHPRDVKSPGPEQFSVCEKNEESFIAQTDSYSLLSPDMHPRSSGATRNHVRSSSAMSMTRSEADITMLINNDGCLTSSPTRRRRSNSISHSLYSLTTAGSETSLILAPRPRSSAYEDMEIIQALNRDGFVPGIFPEKHFVHNIRRFCRFSSASYGPSALKVMGVPSTTKTFRTEESDSHEHGAFSDYAGLPPSSILLSSFVDPEGGTNAAGETETGFPLVHYLCLDHESKAVVLTLRGTWGFEDVLTDMTCDYDDLEWQGRNWKVHKGMHASARRLLEGGGGRVMITISAALDEFPDYGVILCGHSLGGGVAALLATMISEPHGETSVGTSFVTASHESALRPTTLPASNGNLSRTSYFLPPGRPIHVYAYGPPAVMSPLLRRATRGLITTIVNGQDVVPSLSLGILHDMHAVAVTFKSDISGAKSHVRSRFWEGLRQSIINKFYVNQPPMLVHAGDGIGEDAWAWKTLKTLREEMCAPKLVPPGEVFVVDTMRVLQRDAFTSGGPVSDSYPRLGRPATRVQLRFIRSVEVWFGELRFGSGMFADHNPARYEASIAALARGVLDF